MSEGSLMLRHSGVYIVYVSHPNSLGFSSSQIAVSFHTQFYVTCSTEKYRVSLSDVESRRQ